MSSDDTITIIKFNDMINDLQLQNIHNDSGIGNRNVKLNDYPMAKRKSKLKRQLSLWL